MLIALHIRNYRSIRSVELDFKADRDDLSVIQKLKDGSFEKSLLKSGTGELVVPIKNVIGLPGFGKSSVIKALQAVIAIGSGEDPRHYYHPCAEDKNFRDADCEIGITFSFYHIEQLYDASYTVRFNKLGIVFEELKIEDENKTSFKTFEGTIASASSSIIKSSFNPETLLSTCLDENEQQIKTFLTIASCEGMCKSVYKCFKKEFVFLFLDDLSSHNIVATFESFCKEITPYFKNNAKDAEEFTLTQLGILLRDVSSICGVKHKLDLNTGVNTLTLEHKINKSKGVLKGAGSSNNEYSYQLDLDDEGHGTHALILILIQAMKSLIMGRVCVIDDFNSHLPTFPQIYIPRLYKTDRNQLSAQLIIVHNGDRVMIANGEECADEVCCLARTPERGVVLTSGRALLKNHHVEFSHHLTSGPHTNVTEALEDIPNSKHDDKKPLKSKQRIATDDVFADDAQDTDEQEPFIGESALDSPEGKALFARLNQALNSSEPLDDEQIDEEIADDFIEEEEDITEHKSKSKKSKQGTAKSKARTNNKKAKKDPDDDDFFFEPTLES